MTVETSNRLRLTRRFDAAPERVFAAWFDPRRSGSGCSPRPPANRSTASRSTREWAART